MTHTLAVKACDVKIVEKILSPASHMMEYKLSFTISTKEKAFKEYIEEVPLSVIPTEVIDYMRDEICRLRDEVDNRDNYIDSLKEAAKTLIEAASWRDSE